MDCFKKCLHNIREKNMADLEEEVVTWIVAVVAVFMIVVFASAVVIYNERAIKRDAELDEVMTDYNSTVEELCNSYNLN